MGTKQLKVANLVTTIMFNVFMNSKNVGLFFCCCFFCFKTDALVSMCHLHNIGKNVRIGRSNSSVFGSMTELHSLLTVVL